MLAADFGDAPDIYGTTIAAGGAEHIAVGPMLGAMRDVENDGAPSAAANGDGADEDGVVFSALRVGDTNATAIVNVQNAPAGARLDAWIDFDGDGTFSGASERIAANLSVVEGENVVMFAVPVGVASGATYARFRLSSVGRLGPLGGAADGEVEDYAVTIEPPAGSGLFGTRRPIDNSNLGNFAIATDFDRDGDVDVVTVGSSASWFKNDGDGNFTYVNVNFNGYSNPEWFDVIDLDGDGDLDGVGKAGALLYWSENLGDMTFRLKQINYGMTGVLPPKVVDFDRDGDLDFVVAVGNEIRLFESTSAGTFIQKTLLANPSGRHYSAATALTVADADADGDLDVYVAPNDSFLQLVLYRNEGSGSFTRADVVTFESSLFFYRAQTLSPIDFDGDGDIDLAVALRNSSPSSNYPSTAHTLGWYENRGNGEVDYHLVSSNLGDFRQMAVGDVDGDGDFDIVASYLSFGRIVWHENFGDGDFAVRQLSQQSGMSIGDRSIHMGVALGDVDGDGDVDVATTAQSTLGLHWVEQLTAPTADYSDAPYPYPVGLSANGPTHVATGPRLGNERDDEAGVRNSADGNGDGADDDGVTFTPFRVGQLGATVTVNVQNAPAGARLDAWIDFDGDGNWSRAEERIAANLAVVEGSNVVAFDAPSWAMAGASYARFRISTAGGHGYIGAAADGEVEDHAVVISSPGAANGPYFERHAIADSSYVGFYFNVVAVDIDGDGDNDLITPSPASQDLLWHDNDGTGNFTIRTLTGAKADLNSILAAADVDLDGDIDLVTRALVGVNNYVLINNGSQNFTARLYQPTSFGLSSNRLFALADVEGDGDIDYIDEGRWIPNFATSSIAITTNATPSSQGYPIAFADVDRNGALDLLWRSTSGGSTSSGLGFWSHVFNQFQFDSSLGNLTGTPQRLSAADLDQDGDLDLLVAASNAADGIIWFENDGQMNYARRVIGGIPVGAVGTIVAADVDGDGDLDVLASSSNETAWFENDGEETFTKHSVLPAGGLLSLADMNGDGALDVVLYDRSTNGPVSGLAWYSLTDRQVSVAAAPATIDEEGNASIVFTFTRAGVTDGELTLPFTVGGGALYGVDYTVSGAASFNATAGTITFAAGVTRVEATLTPIDDAIKEFHERATLTIPPLAGYSIGSAIATATIRTAELAGDYDSDGTVDGADFLAWQRSFGQAAEPIGSGADGNLDGETDGDDLAVWTENFGETTVTLAPSEIAITALVAADEDASATATASESWFGRLAGDEAAIIAIPVAESAAKRVGRRHDVREEAFARTRRWFDSQVGVQRFQRTFHASSLPAEDAERGDAEAFDELASELAQTWREF